MNKLKRRYSHSRNKYIIEDINWIKEQILKLYHTQELPSHPIFKYSMGRKFFIHVDKSNYSHLGYIFFSIEGSPPNGCAIYQEDNQFIIIVSAWGETKKYRNAIISKKLMDSLLK